MAFNVDDEEFQIMLIEEVKKRPFFYNKADENYMNRDMVKDEWETVAAIIGSLITVGDLDGKYTQTFLLHCIA